MKYFNGYPKSKQCFEKKWYFRKITYQVINRLQFLPKTQRILFQIQDHTDQYYPFPPEQIMCILYNLIENAVKYNREYNGWVGIIFSDNDTGLTINIYDNGIGIDESFHKKVFEPGFRVSDWDTGHGLGLYQVKEIVENLGGSICLYSAPGDVTRFTVFLPCD